MLKVLRIFMHTSPEVYILLNEVKWGVTGFNFILMMFEVECVAKQCKLYDRLLKWYTM